MKKHSYGQLVKMSWERTAQILFKPFSLKKWIMLTVIILLAGQMGGFNFNINWNKADFEKIMNHLTKKVPLPSAAIGETAPTGLAAPQTLNMQNIRSLPVFKDPQKAMLLVLIVGGVLLLLGLLLFLWMWVNANFSFVFLESVVKNDASLRIPFHKNKPQGNSYLMWNIFFSTVAILLLCAIIIPPAAKIIKSGMFSGKAAFDIAKIFSIAAPYIPALIASIVALVLITFIVIDFILPIMYRKKIGVLRAWSVFLNLLWKNLGEILLYFLVKLGLGILAVLASIVLLIIGVILFILAGGLCWLLGWLIYLITPLAAKVVVLIVLVTLGVCILIFLSILFSLLFLPIPVFFRIFPLYLLGSIDESLDLFTAKPAEGIIIEDDAQYKKSMALVWFTVLSPLIIVALALLAAIIIPYLARAKQAGPIDVKSGQSAPIEKKEKLVRVYLKNGNSFKATIEQESESNISFGVEGGTFILPRSDILRIEK